MIIITITIVNMNIHNKFKKEEIISSLRLTYS